MEKNREKMLKFIILFIVVILFMFLLVPIMLCRIFCKQVTMKDIKRMFYLCYGEVDLKKLKQWTLKK